MTARAVGSGSNQYREIAACFALTAQRHAHLCKPQAVATSLWASAAELLWPTIHQDFSKAPKCRLPDGGRRSGPILQGFLRQWACVPAWTSLTYAQATVGSLFK